MRSLFKAGILMAFAICVPEVGRAQPPREIQILAAADLQPVMPALSAAYEHATGIKLVVSFGSSATLATQIINGSPADLFLAADYSFPESIIAANLADTSAPIEYARGTLVLWAPKSSPLQPLTQDTLRTGKFEHLAIADPDHAPYGRAAVSALTWMKLYEQMKPRIVIAENIAQAAQFVESGNAQVGLISLTSASTDHMKQMGSFLRMPKVYPDIRQCAVVMRKSPNRDDAHAFLNWLLSADIQKNLAQYGLDPAH